MLTRLGSRALSTLGYGNNDDSTAESEMELYDSKVISGDWVFIREKRPQRSCTKQNSHQKEEWFTVIRKQNKKKPTSENVNLEYDTMEDLLESEEGVNTKQKDSRETTGFVENQNNSVGTVLTRNQRRLMMAAEESKLMLERGTKPKRLQNTSSGKIQNKHQNKVVMQTESNKRGRKRHMMASTYSGKGGRRGS
jgi:hypothetical protein